MGHPLHALLARRDGSTTRHSGTSDGLDGMHNRLLHELELKNALSDALDNRELQVHYQPIVSLESGEIVALEALVR